MLYIYLFYFIQYLLLVNVYKSNKNIRHKRIFATIISVLPSLDNVSSNNKQHKEYKHY